MMLLALKVIFSASRLYRAIANGNLSVRPSVRLSAGLIKHTRDQRLNGSRYLNAFCTTR